jgi:hypothetical protein
VPKCLFFPSTISVLARFCPHCLAFVASIPKYWSGLPFPTRWLSSFPWFPPPFLVQRRVQLAATFSLLVSLGRCRRWDAEPRSLHISLQSPKSLFTSADFFCSALVFSFYNELCCPGSSFCIAITWSRFSILSLCRWFGIEFLVLAFMPPMISFADLHCACLVVIRLVVASIASLCD